MLDKLADCYGEDVARPVDSLTSCIEPVMMATRGLSVGGVGIALYMPMFNSITIIK